METPCVRDSSAASHMSGLRHPGVLERLDIRIPRLALDGERGGQILTASFFKGVSLPIQPFPIFPTGVCSVRSLGSSLSFPSFKKKRTKSKQISEEAREDANSYVARGIRA